jgi:AraC-like DNA-binding protein
MASTLRAPVRLPQAGSVTRLHQTTSVRRLGSLLASLGNPGDASGARHCDPTEGLIAVTNVLVEAARRPLAPSARQIDSSRVIHKCIDYADVVGGRPSLPDLCAVTNVSERRLRKAFADVFDMPPTAYFRFRSLNLARGQFLLSEAPSVTAVAFQLGWSNLGRFAQSYRQVFGEPPSRTLAAAQATARNQAQPPAA